MNILKPEKFEIDPSFEIIRGLKYEAILKSFIISCTKSIGKEIFNKKKSCIRTLTNILASWMFSLYSDYDFNDDSFFPNDCSNISNLELTLVNFCKFDKHIIDPKLKVDKIISNLKEVYAKNLSELKKYKYLNKDKEVCNYEISKVEKKFIRNNKETIFYKFLINHNIEIYYNRLINIIDNILIPKDIYLKLKNKYTGDDSKFDLCVWTMTYRYQLLGSNNNQLGVLPENLLNMKSDFGMDFELFGSSINFTLTDYCSLYYDVEKYFGSSGSFFNFNPTHGIYSFNPPYQSDIITKGVYKLFDLLDNNSLNYEDDNRLSFIITIPIWDNMGKKIMKYQYPQKKTIEEIEYGDFDIINELNKSKYFKLKLMISKNNFTYLDHNFHLYKNSTIQNTYIYVLSNDSNKDFSKLNEYNFKDY
jgi:hypothetical protein